MAEIPWTAEQLTTAVAGAVAAHDFDAVEHLLRLLVVVDPEQAQDVWDTLQLGISLTRDRP